MKKGWEEIFFFNFIKLNRGFDLPNNKIEAGNYPVIASTSIKAYHKNFKVIAPCVTTGRSGSLGVVQYVNQDSWPLNTTLYVKDFKKNDPKFVYYFLQTMDFDTFNSGAGVPTLNQNHLHHIKIQIPKDINHQKRIASILSAYDDLIEVNNKRIELLEQSARELYKEWFVRMRFPNYQNTKFNKGIPEGWKEKNCYHIVNILGGGTPSTNNPTYWNGNILFYTPSDYTPTFFSFNTEKKLTEKGLMNSSTKLFPKHTTFVTARGTIGNLIMAGYPMAMNQSCFGLIAKEKEELFFIFLYAEQMVNYLKLVASGATFDAITLKTFENYKSKIPNKELRILFNQKVSPIFTQIETLQKQNQELTAIRDRLLPRLISGKLEVKA